MSDATLKPGERNHAALTSLRQQLLERIDRLRADQRRSHGALSADSSERVVERENDEVVDSILAAAEVELGLVERALGRIESGHYGTCTSCGEPIGKARLKSLPYSELCGRCAGLAAARP